MTNTRITDPEIME